MAKRKLTDRQKARVTALQTARAERANRTGKRGAPGTHEPLGPEQSGLVISAHRAAAIVENADGRLNRCTVRQNLGALVCGDRVVWQSASNGDGVVVALLERRSLLTRPGIGGHTKPVAANIDQIVIVAATEPQLSHYLIDRYLVAAEATNIQPVIVVNKTELLDPAARATLQRALQVYRDIGYGVLFTSAKTEHGLDPLVEQLRDRTSILVGQSGVGKSSLVKMLLPERDIRIGALTEARHGRHTTSTAVLYHLPFGGDLIDSPGVRDFGLWHMDREQITAGFIEFCPYLGHCKFSNCTHTSEPQCALRQAVEDGKISGERLNSYHRMIESLEQGPRT